MNVRERLYLLGALPSLLFSARFFIQWIASERRKESVVPKLFWILSLLGNGMMCVHAFIQLQFPLCFLQGLSFLIVWRNLNLKSHHPFSLRKTLVLFTLILTALTCLFFLQGGHYMRSPLAPHREILWQWHVLGTISMLLFASRFWVQWIAAERKKESHIPLLFWWLSMIGASFSLLYFFHLRDLVQALGYGLGLIPYVRNLFLQPKKKVCSDTIFLFAGEESATVIGADLIKHMKEYSTFGVGGDGMKQGGMIEIAPMSAFHVMGFAEIITAFPRLAWHFFRLKKAIIREQPKAAILIDSPDFNLPLARALKKGGYKGTIVQYVCPTVWAWRKYRTQQLIKRVDLLLSIFPFEKRFFEGTPLPVSYVGYPAADLIARYTYRERWHPSPPELALFPGSRKREILYNLPLMLKATKHLKLKLGISLAREELRESIEMTLHNEGIEAELISKELRYEMMRDATVGLATSGTITVECALHSLPCLVLYKIKPLNFFLAKYLFRIHLPFFAPTNIIAEQEIYPEFVDTKIDPLDVKKSVDAMLKNLESHHKALEQFRAKITEKRTGFEASQAIKEALCNVPAAATKNTQLAVKSTTTAP